MNRRRFLRRSGVVVAATVAGCGGEDPGETVVPVTRPGHWPYAFRRDRELMGFEVALANRVIERAGLVVGDWEPLDDRAFVESVTASDGDLAVGRIDATRSAPRVTVTDRYYRRGVAALVAEGSGLDPTEPRHLIEDRVGVRAGTAADRLLRRLLRDGVVEPGDFRSYDDYPTAFERLLGGDVDELLVPRPIAGPAVDRHSIRVAFVEPSDAGFGMLVAADDPRGDQIVDALQNVVGSEAYDDLVAEWFFRPSPLAPDDG